MADIEERTRKIVVEHLAVDTDKVTTDAKLCEDLGADSLDVVELVMAFEDEFGCEITDSEAVKLTSGTFGDCVTLIGPKL